MMMPVPRRRGYTLLEILLATAIGVILMGALYVAMDMQMRQTQAGRDLVEQTTLARSLVARISSDVSSNLAPVDPSRFRASSSQAPPSGGMQPGGTGPAPGGTATQPGGTGATTTPDAAAGAQGAAPSSSTGVVFNLGVQGDATRLVLFVSRVPREAFGKPADDTDPPVISDLRRITYWLASEAGNPIGLARQEVKVATSEELDFQPPDIPEFPEQLLAEEVKGVLFRYWDGTTWQDSWDGSMPGADGQTPIGPPLGIEINLELAVPSSNPRPGELPVLRRYRHFVALTTANGPTVQNNDTGATSTPSTPSTPTTTNR